MEQSFFSFSVKSLPYSTGTCSIRKYQQVWLKCTAHLFCKEQSVYYNLVLNNLSIYAQRVCVVLTQYKDNRSHANNLFYLHWVGCISMFHLSVHKILRANIPQCMFMQELWGKQASVHSKNQSEYEVYVKYFKVF